MAPKSRKSIMRVYFWTLPLLWCQCVVTVDQRPVPTDLQKQVLHNTFKALLNYQRQPSYTNATNPLEEVGYRSRSLMVASKYMKKLFQRYQSNAVITKSQGNIARSISPTIGIVNGERVLKFNLNAVHGQEAVIKAELHYHYGNRKRRGRRAPICLLVSPSGERTEIKQIGWDQSDQWIAYDVRNAVVAAVQQMSSHKDEAIFNRHQKSAYISVAFVGDSLLLPYSEKYYTPEKVLRHHAPFLLVHSEETDLVDQKQMLSAVLVEANSKNNVEDNETRRKRSAAYEQYFQYAVNEQKGPNLDDGQFEQHVRAFQEQGPAVLQPMRSNRRRQGQYKRNNNFESNRKFERRRQPFGSTNVKDNRSVRRENDQRQNSKSDDYATVVLLSGVEPKRCNKHNLIVDFRDIGWGDQIIAPKTFQAHYCAGSCHFPLSWNSNPSNHAIIQSIIHTIGLQPNVPEVCCSPDKMDSLTLLYFDEDQNVVLKTYPKMIVTSCGCM